MCKATEAGLFTRHGTPCESAIDCEIMLAILEVRSGFGGGCLRHGSRSINRDVACPAYPAYASADEEARLIATPAAA